MLRAGLQRSAEIHALYLRAGCRHPAQVAAAAGIHHGRRISGHRRAAVHADAGAVRLSPQPLRRGRSRPDDLYLARSEHPVSAGLRSGLSRYADDPDDGKLPLHAADPVRGKFAHRQKHGPHGKIPAPHPAGRRAGPSAPRAQRGGRGRMDGRADADPARRRDTLSRHDRALPRALSHADGRGGAPAGEDPLYHLQRRAVFRPRRDQGRPVLPAHDRLSGRPVVPAHRQPAETQHRRAPPQAAAGAGRTGRLFAVYGPAPQCRHGGLPRHGCGTLRLAHRCLFVRLLRPVRLGGPVRHPARKRL